MKRAVVQMRSVVFWSATLTVRRPQKLHSWRPHRGMIVARLEDIDLQKRARRRSEQKVVKTTPAVPGAFGASRSLEVVQIDHTKADVFVVGEETRQPIGRPWLTLAMRFESGVRLVRRQAARPRAEHRTACRSRQPAKTHRTRQSSSQRY